MRVLLISPLPPPAGGIASWTKRYLESKTATENEIDIVDIALVGERMNNSTGRKNIIVEYKRLYRIIKNLKIKLREKKYDIVHLNSSCSFTGLIRDLIIAHIAKRNKTKLLVHFRCDVSYYVSERSVAIILLKKIVCLSDIVLTLNKVSHDFIMNVFKKKSYIIPNFISDDYLMEASKSKIITEIPETFLFVGHITNEKGCDLIYKTAAVFPEKRFILVGKIINTAFATNSKPPNIILKGELPLSQVKEEYLKADVFIFPTHTEGFPNAVAEAMACGMPIIATPVGALPDMIENDGGILIPVNDENACIEAVKKVNSPELRKKMSEFNRNKVMSQYAIEKVLKTLFDIYGRR